MSSILPPDIGSGSSYSVKEKGPRNVAQARYRGHLIEVIAEHRWNAIPLVVFVFIKRLATAEESGGGFEKVEAELSPTEVVSTAFEEAFRAAKVEIDRRHGRG